MHRPTSPFSAARWIWPGPPFFDLRNSYALFRKTLDLTTVPDQATSYVTADQSYQLYVNGHPICRGPARGYQWSWPYDEIDVAAWLRPGKNVIAVRVHHPGFSNFQYRSEGFAGLLFAADWGVQPIVSDPTWRCRLQSGMARDTVPSSLQLFCQEHLDTRIEPDDWMMPDYDDSTASWTYPTVSAAWNSAPWHDLEPRGIPLLAEKEIGPPVLLGVATGRSADGFAQTRNVVEIVRREDRWHVPAGEIRPNDADSYSSYLYDFGHTVVGNLRLQITHAVGGERVDALFAETLETRGSALAPRLDQSQVSLGSRLICRPGSIDHTFYHPYGFRYLVVRIRKAATSFQCVPTLRSVGYPLEISGHFHSSDEELNRIWQACRRTQLVCSLDAYVDTPWREQAQWWGDARVQAANTFHLADDPRLLRRGIKCIARQTTPDGLTYGHAPTVAHHCILPDFTLIWALTLWDDYWQTGNLETFNDAENQQTLARALDYFRNQTDPAIALVRSDPRHWLFLDWAPLSKEGQPAILSLWLLLALDRVSQLYQLAGNPDAAHSLQTWMARLRSALLALFDEGDGLYFDGYDKDGKRIAQKSLHAQTLALMTGLPDEEQPQRIIEHALLPFVREESNGLVPPSVYWCTYVFGVLDEAGHGEAVVRYIRKHWSRMADHGTTWSQLGEYGGEHSHSHAWSAHPLYHLMQILGGIRQLAAGWTAIEFRPLFWGNQAEVCLPTPHGRIEVAWKETETGRFAVDLKVPAGITAEIRLPGQEMKSVPAGNWQWVCEISECADRKRSD